ncbi:hypothetical protein BKA56DRAFT_622243 [Ilyonectria sp. MPI-CAGE-AT-0026]|nr:hypothetical protein BKA56DRAFT_622243 [Ilyonectria sp. MPI-CAGE-AT-0026]
MVVPLRDTATNNPLCGLCSTGTTYCSTSLSTSDVNQTCSYIARGVKSGTDHYQITPNEETTTTIGFVSITSPAKSKTTCLSELLITSIPESGESTTKFTTSDEISKNISESTSTKTETQITATSDENEAQVAFAEPGVDSSWASGSSTNVGVIIGGVIGGLRFFVGLPL